jgi:phosphatidate cytidylyltransferase
MFKQRLITALILIPLVLLLLFVAPVWMLVGVLCLVLMVCGWEWLHLIPLTEKWHQSIFMGALALSFVACQLYFSLWLSLGLISLVGLFFAEITYPKTQSLWGRLSIVTGLAFLLLPLFLESVLQVINAKDGRVLLLYMFLLVWSADVGAYLAGKKWGVHKLIPLVSPGKSFEGALGGLALVLCVTGLGFYYFKPHSLMLWLIVSFTVFVVSIVGDLSISMLKRRVGLKDTGTLLPGHGGFLDRLDSLIAVAPVFYVLYQAFFPSSMT